MSFPIDLIIGSTTLSPTQRLNNSAFTANLKKVTNAQRSQSGRLHTNTLYKKYEVAISGMAQSLIASLRYEYERDDLIDLYMIVDRIERLSASGVTTAFNVTRRMRLDNTNCTPYVEYPIGTRIAAASITALTNTDTVGQLDLSFTPTAGTLNVLVGYYPILSGIISDMTASYAWAQDEETWSLTFSEE